MNIFFLSLDPVEAARFQVDKHVVKMIVETGQLLSTAHRLLDGFNIVIELNGGKVSKPKNKWILRDDRDNVMYKATHINHPCAVWTRTSVENYNWLVDHFFALGDEYTYRYGKKHKTIEKLGFIVQSPPMNLKTWDWTTPPLAMPDEYKHDDVVQSYRHYYKEAKKHLHKWKNRSPPEWMEL